MLDAVALSGILHRLSVFIEEMRHAAGSYPYKGPAAFELVVLVRAELRRRFQRFERALARFRAGELPRPRSKSAASAPDGDAPARIRDRSREAPRLPRRKAWLVVMMPYVMALHAIRLRMYADDPDAAAFLRACPEARRILRPIWWMVSSDPLPDPLREPPEGQTQAQPPATGSALATDAESPDAPPAGREACAADAPDILAREYGGVVPADATPDVPAYLAPAARPDETQSAAPESIVQSESPDRERGAPPGRPSLADRAPGPVSGQSGSAPSKFVARDGFVFRD